MASIEDGHCRCHARGIRFPEWLDVDTWKARNEFWENKLPSADGVFYLLVHDAFGRETRFDIEYQKWSRVVSRSDPTRCKIDANYFAQNRWWQVGTGGTSVSGDAFHGF
jgi:hypothetical protein